MNISRAAVLVAFVVLVAVVVGVLITRGDSGTDPATAKTCQELVSRSAKVVRKIVTDLGTKTREDLEAENPDNPFASLEEPFASFSRRAEELQHWADVIARPDGIERIYRALTAEMGDRLLRQRLADVRRHEEGGA